MIKIVFDWTAQALDKVAKRLHLTYNEVNIIVYFMLIPLTWMVMVDFIVHCWPLLTVIWAAICLIGCGWHLHDFRQWCDRVFNQSVNFLLWFRCIGWNYYKASDIICVAVPLLVYAGLGWLLLRGGL